MVINLQYFNQVWMETSAKFDDIKMTNSKVRDQYDQENNRGKQKPITLCIQNTSQFYDI